MRRSGTIITPLFLFLLSTNLVYPIQNALASKFSLKAGCSSPLTGLESTYWEKEGFWAQLDMPQQGTNPVVAQIREEIVMLKKKKKTSLIASIACAVVGGAFMYGFATYGEQIEPGRDPSQDQTKDPMFSRKRLYILGAATAFAVSITLYFDVASKNRAIKAREEELKRLAEETSFR